MTRASRTDAGRPEDVPDGGRAPGASGGGRARGTPDAGREAVYAAEAAAFDGTDLEVPLGIDRAIELAHRVVADPWWQGPAVSAGAARRDAASSSCRVQRGDDLDGDRSTPVEIRLAAPQTTIATVAHELAHALAGPASGHGPLFRRAYLDVVEVVTNLDPTDRRRGLHGDQLAEAFAALGLPVGRRRWPPPPDSTSGAIAL